jgi:YVTN family beta-propeller protein
MPEDDRTPELDASELDASELDASELDTTLRERLVRFADEGSSALERLPPAQRVREGAQRRRGRRLAVSSLTGLATVVVAVMAIALWWRQGPEVILGKGDRPAVWLLAGWGDGPLLKIDPARNTVVATVDVGSSPQHVLATPTTVWVSSESGLRRIDPDTTTVTGVVRPGAVGDLAYDGTDLWGTGDHQVLRLDPTTGAVRGTLPLSFEPSGLVVTAGRVWVADFRHDSVVALDPVSGHVMATVAVGESPTAMSFDGHDLWIGNGLANSLSQVDPTTARTVRTVSLGDRPDHPFTGVPSTVQVAGPTVWAVTLPHRLDSGWSLVGVDLATGKVVATLGAPGALGMIATDGRDLWLPRRLLGHTVIHVDGVSRTTVGDVVATSPLPSS